MKSVIECRKLIPFELPYPLLLILLLSSLMLIGCDNQNETSTDSSPQTDNISIQIPDSIASRLPADGSLTAFLTVNEVDQPPSAITGDTATFTLSGTTGETLNISITFTFDLDPFGPLVVAASTTKSLVVSAGAQINFVVGDYDTASFNQDGDHFDNLAELSAGSDPTDANNTPVVNRVVFTGDLVIDNVFELFSADLTGGARIKLSPSTLQINGDVSNVVLSPDRHYVAFTADAIEDGINEVYVAPVDGSTAAVKVSSVGFVITPGNTFVNALTLQWAPDSSRIAWLGDFRIDNVTELYTATPTGSQQTVNGPIVANGDVIFDYLWSPDSTRLAYRADQDTNDVIELYTAFADGTGRLKVSGPMAPNGDVVTFRWAPDSSRLAYTSDQDSDNVVELFTANPAVAGSAIRVSQNQVHPNADVSSAFDWAPDSSHIAYIHDRNTDGIDDLYTTVPDSNAQVIKVNNSSLVPGEGATSQFITFQWSPDSSLLAYEGDVETDNIFELFIDTPDSQRASPKVSGTLLGMGGVDQFEWSPDGSILVFSADANIDNIFEVFSVPADGGSRTQLSEKNHAGTELTFVEFPSPRAFSPDGAQIVYSAPHDSGETDDLYLATPGVEKSAVNLTSFPPVNGFESLSLSSINISPNAKNIAFVSNLFINAPSFFSRTVNVQVVPLDGSTPEVNVTSNGPDEGFPSPPGWDPGSVRFVYSNDDDPADTITSRIFTNTARGTDQIEVSGTIVNNGGAFSPQIAGFLPEIEDNDSSARSLELPFGLPVAGTVSPTDDDFFRFTPKASAIYEFQLSTTATVLIEILDTDGLTVLPGGSGAKLLRPALDAGSSYFVKLSGNGDYRFTFGLPNNNNRINQGEVD